MTTHYPMKPVSRRRTLAALAGGGLGVAVAAVSRPATAQERATMADHPVIGAWSVEFEPAKPARLLLLVTFHSDGSMVWSHPLGGIGIGVWTVGDDQTIDSMVKFQNIADEAGEYVAGTVTSWSSFTLEGDNQLVERAVVEVMSSDGTVVARFPHEPTQPFKRLVVEAAPPLDAPAATPAS